MLKKAQIVLVFSKPKGIAFKNFNLIVYSLCVGVSIRDFERIKNTVMPTANCFKAIIELGQITVSVK